uniref:Glycosyl hydrolase, BNR repeat-containing protein n=1 Tax=Solibacter usitatus (strain Ellin6076) TaxID=234267 RepID=Q029Z0_SOLUE
MRNQWIARIGLSMSLFVFTAAPILAQEADAPKLVLPKKQAEGEDHFEKMTPMARLAWKVAKARAGQPNFGRGRSFKADYDPTLKPDICAQGDEDCGQEGFQDGPGSTQSEMSIAVDTSGQHIVVGFNDFRGFTNPQSVSGFAYSDNGGITFTDGGQLPVTSNGSISGTLYPQVDGDPDIKFVPGGAGCQFIYASIMVVGLPKASAPAFTGTAQTMSIHRSTDCGHTWSGPYEVLPATNPTGVLSGLNARDAADKEFIDVDPDTGRVLLSWSNFTAASVIPGGVQISTTFSDNIMSATPPTWSPGVVLNSGAATFDTGSVPRFAGNGSPNVYVFWATSSNSTGLGNTRVAVSTNNGVSFGPSVALNAGDFFAADYILGDDRIHSFPIAAVDNSSGASHGNVYVVYGVNNNHDGGDIAFHRSTNGGATFSAPVLLNARPGGDRSQWFPVVVTDPNTGRVSVMYDDQGNATSGDLMQMTWMYSDDGGVTWSKPSPLTRPFHAGYGNDTSQPNLGDYNALAARNGTVYAAFTAVPNVVGFNDGQPNSGIGYPSFLGNTIPGGTAPAPGFGKVTAAKAALDLMPITFTESGGNGFIDAGDQVRMTIPLRNYVTNAAIGTVTYTGVNATLSTTAPGVTFQRAASTYPDIAPGTSQSNALVYILTLSPSFVPGTKIDFSLSVSTAQGNTALLFTQDTGTPVPTTVFSENFNGVSAGTLPAGWATIHVGGTPTVNWTTSSSFCGTASNGLFHVNANDTTASNRTRFERVSSPNITIPANAQFVTIDFDICYDLEDEPAFNILGYDGADLRITDFTAGHFARANFVEALADTFTTGTSLHYPKHLPRNSNTNYFQDISAWSGDSGGFKHVSMRFNGMAGDTIQLRPDYTQDSGGICSDVRPGHSCGVLIDNIVVNAVVTKSDELSTLTLRPVAGQTGVYTGTVTSQAIAPAGGITVNLSSNFPAQTTMPASVVIPAGSQTSAGFTVTITHHGSTTIITGTGPSNARAGSVLLP